jgi:hypothetical protein
MKKCVICGCEFIAIKSAVTCSKVCSDINKRNRKPSVNSKLNYTNKLKDQSLELQLPRYIIKEYGYDFIKSNKEVLDSLLLMHAMSGRLRIPEEAKQARLNARVTPTQISKRKLTERGPIVGKCAICGKDIVVIGKTKTCDSDECKQTLYHRNDKVYKDKYMSNEDNRIKHNIKVSEYYPARYAKFCEEAKAMNMTHREYKKYKKELKSLVD